MYPLHNSRIVRYNSGIGGQSRNSYFAQDSSGIVPIPTLRRTYICTVANGKKKGFEPFQIPKPFLGQGRSCLECLNEAGIVHVGKDQIDNFVQSDLDLTSRSGYQLCEWCFTSLSKVFQSYQGVTTHYSCLSCLTSRTGM